MASGTRKAMKRSHTITRAEEEEAVGVEIVPGPSKEKHVKHVPADLEVSLMHKTELKPYVTWPRRLKDIYSYKIWNSRHQILEMMVFFFVNSLSFFDVFEYIDVRKKIPHSEDLAYAKEVYEKMRCMRTTPVKPFLSFHVQSQRFRYIDGCDFYDSECYIIDKYVENRFQMNSAKLMEYKRYNPNDRKTRVLRYFPDGERNYCGNIINDIENECKCKLHFPNFI